VIIVPQEQSPLSNLPQKFNISNQAKYQTNEVAMHNKNKQCLQSNLVLKRKSKKMQRDNVMLWRSMYCITPMSCSFSVGNLYSNKYTTSTSHFLGTGVNPIRVTDTTPEQKTPYAASNYSLLI
jgi:hypothetical protein